MRSLPTPHFIDRENLLSRRGLFTLAVALGTWLLSMVYFTQVIDPSVKPIQGQVTLVNVLAGLLVLSWLLNGRSLRRAEFGAYLALAITTLVQVPLLAAAPAPPGMYPNGGPYWAMVCVSATGFIVLSLRAAWIMNGLIMVYCLTVPWLIHGSYAMQQPFNLLRIQISALMVALMLGMIASLRVKVDQQRITEDTLMRLAFSDSLTGLLNRRAVYTAVEELLRAVEHGQPGTLFLIDLDYFKNINDRFGHSVGDDVLVAFGHLLARSAAIEGYGPPTVGRWGGEEFIVILPGADSVLGKQRAEQLVQQVNESIWPQRIHLTISLGCTTVRPGDDFNQVLARADQALYQAKAQGRNQAVVAEYESAEETCFPGLALPQSRPA